MFRLYRCVDVQDRQDTRGNFHAKKKEREREREREMDHQDWNSVTIGSKKKSSGGGGRRPVQKGIARPTNTTTFGTFF